MYRATLRPFLSLLLLVSLGMIWGTGYSIARFAVTNGVHPLGYSFWQSIGPAILMFMIVMLRHGKFHLSVSQVRFYLVCGLTGIAIPNTSMYFAAAHLPAGTLALIVNTVPVFAYPMAIFMRLETFNWQRVLGIFLAFLGLMAIMLPKSGLPSPDLIPWAIGTLTAPVSFALCSIYIARFRPANCDSLTLSTGMLMASTLLLSPLVLYTHHFYYLQLPFTLPDWIILLEIILSTIGYVLFFQLIEMAGPVFYSLVDTVVVLTGVWWGYFIFNEHLNKWTGMAVCLIVVALVLVTKNQRQATDKQSLST